MVDIRSVSLEIQEPSLELNTPMDKCNVYIHKSSRLRKNVFGTYWKLYWIQKAVETWDYLRNRVF
jgi:hypothetical protein